MDESEQDENLKSKLALSRLSSQLRNMAQISANSPSISSSSEESDDLSDDEGEKSGLDYLLSGQKKDLASTCRLLLSDEESLNRDLSNLTLVAPETQARLEALLEVAGVAADGKAFTDPEVLRQLTSSVSSALDEAAAALTRMRSQAGGPPNHIHDQGTRSLVEACIEGDIAAVRKLLDEGRSVHEPTDEGESLLSLACSAGYYELVQVLLAMNANVEDRGSKGDCTPLMEAASGGFVDIVRLLLQHHANVNSQSSSGNTALHYASCGGYDDVVSVLLEHSADLEHQNENGHTPLMEAASGGHTVVAKLLLDKGAGINTHSSEFKESALTLAAYKGHVDMVQFLLEKGADQEHKTDEMHTALMEASMDGHVEVAKLLLQHGAQVNMPADSFESPLTLAACGSHVDLAHLLIQHGANLEEVNDEGYTPLMEAAREGYLPMVALLLEHGCNINAQTEETQETALTLACCGGFKEVVSFLLEAGADIELGASTPLMEAATEGHADMVKFLLDKDAKVDTATATGDTALTYACENGHMSVAEVLLEYGAELEHESEGGRTPIMKAARAGHKETVEFLIRKGANVNGVTTSKDHSVLSLSCAGGHTEVVQLLLAYGADPCQKLKDNSSMLIEASKGGHTAVALLLMEAPSHINFIDSPLESGFNTPVGSPNESSVGQIHACQHQQNRIQYQECGHECKHLPPVQDCFAHTCSLGVNCSMISPPPSVVQPNAINNSPFTGLPSTFGGQQILATDVAPNMVTSSSEFIVPNIPVSLPSSPLPLTNLTPADLQSLAQALSYSASVNSLHSSDNIVSTSATVAENLGIAATVNFPMIDPSVGNMFSSPDIDFAQHPSSAIQNSIGTISPNRPVTSTGVQTEDAISMIHRLTDSVQHLSALQNFAASHNLELVNLGEITIPPTQFQANIPQEDDILVAEPARPLHDTLAHMTREDPVGECSPQPQIPIAPHSRVSPPPPVAILNQQTDSNHDTALTISCAGGHDDLVQVLLAKGSDKEHRDKKGCTPLILAATAGHASTCRILLDNECDIEAQSDRTKDTALSLACSSGRQEVVELLLASGSNYEHRNVSDYTPLSLAASGGYVGIIKVLVQNGAEINSRTGSKLGISPLMLAAMNGHVTAVKLLLDMGSDVNAQIETNRNTALTLACFQGRHEVVALLLDRKANVEHRAKTGLTPLMEAASGGYVEVGHVLIERGADVNAPPVPSSRDTALTIAADKGHYKFVELLLNKHASVDVKSKKGCSPAWLAANGGHLEVLQLLSKYNSDIDCQDNRGISCLMAAFRKGHVKVVKWLVKHAKQFPADCDCKRFMLTIPDKDLLKKLQECMEVIISAKDRQAAEANKYASILLEEIDHEKEREERRKAALAKKRDKKKMKKKKKVVDSEHVNIEDNGCNHLDEYVKDTIYDRDEKEPINQIDEKPRRIEANWIEPPTFDKKGKTIGKDSTPDDTKLVDLDHLNTILITTAVTAVTTLRPLDTASATTVAEITKAVATSIMSSMKSTRSIDSHAISSEVAATMATAAAQCAIVSLSSSSGGFHLAHTVTSPKKNKRIEDGWKEVTRRSKKIQIPAALISRVIGRGGCNVNAIRESTSAHIDIDTNRKKPNGDCMVTIKGSQLSTRQAYNYIDALIKDPERDVTEILPMRSRKLDSSSAIIQKHSSLSSFPNLPSSSSKSTTPQYNHLKSSPPRQQILQQPHPKHSAPTCVSPNTRQTIKSSSAQNMPSQNRLPPRMGGVNTVAATTATTTTTMVKIESTGWVSRTSTTNQNIISMKKVSNHQGSPVTVVKPTVTRQSIVSSSKPLPKPIGSNRPVKMQVSKESTQTTQSTKTTPSVSTQHVSGAHITTTHSLSQSSSALNSFFSQVATQARSPMIWNGPEISSDASCIIVSSSISKTATATTPQCFVPTSAKAHNTSPTPSVSPTPSNSASPSPSCVNEERPHLNPIGTERAHKRCSTNNIPNIPRMPAFEPSKDADPKGVWGFGFKSSIPTCSAWSVCQQTWSNSDGIPGCGGLENNQTASPTNEIEDDTIDISQNDTLQSVLQRLELSDYLSNFQKNEIDLEALMLMTEQDYADIGLPVIPRKKLMRSTQRFSDRNVNEAKKKSIDLNPANSAFIPPTNIEQIQSHGTLWSTPAIVANGLIQNNRKAQDFKHPQIMHVPSWRPWSRTDQ